MANTLRERLIGLIEPAVGALGYELVELEYGAGHGRATLKVFIDAPAGVEVALEALEVPSQLGRGLVPKIRILF